MRLLAAAILGAAVFVPGCTSYVRITSEPSGAQVRIDGIKAPRTTPTSVRVTWWAWEKNRITLDHPDYHRFSTVLRRTPQVEFILLDLVSLYGIMLLPVNSVGPIKRQHFVLRLREEEAHQKMESEEDILATREEAPAPLEIAPALLEIDPSPLEEVPFPREIAPSDGDKPTPPPATSQ